MRALKVTILSIVVVLFLEACASNGSYVEDPPKQERSSHGH